MATKIGAAKVKILKLAGTSTYKKFRRPPPRARPTHEFNNWCSWLWKIYFCNNEMFASRLVKSCHFTFPEHPLTPNRQLPPPNMNDTQFKIHTISNFEPRSVAKNKLFYKLAYDMIFYFHFPETIAFFLRLFTSSRLF